MVSRPLPLRVVNSIESLVTVIRGEVATLVGLGRATTWSARCASRLASATTSATAPTATAVSTAGSRERGGRYVTGSGAPTGSGPSGRLQAGCALPGANDGPLGLAPIPDGLPGDPG